VVFTALAAYPIEVAKNRQKRRFSYQKFGERFGIVKAENYFYLNFLSLN